MYIVLMGAPGAGKGTQAAALAKEFNIPHVSTGDIFRAAAEESTERGSQIRLSMKLGRLIPDELTNQLVEERLLESGDEGLFRGCILDGYPRTESQALFLDVILKARRKEIKAAVNIVVPTEDLIGRSVGRRVCKNCGATYHVQFNPPRTEGICNLCGGALYQRADDTVETLTNRLNVYMKSTLPLIDYYKKQGKYIQVDGGKAIDLVTTDLIKVLTPFKN